MCSHVLATRLKLPLHLMEIYNSRCFTCNIPGSKRGTRPTLEEISGGIDDEASSPAACELNDCVPPDLDAAWIRGAGHGHHPTSTHESEPQLECALDVAGAPSHRYVERFSPAAGNGKDPLG